MPHKTALAAALALAASHAAFAEVTETVSEGKDREAVAVTIITTISPWCARRANCR